MKLPGGMDFGNMDLSEMMKQAQEMQEELQRDMQSIKVEANVGGGAVKVVMNGSKELVDLKIEPELAKSGDVEMLQELIIAAINEGARKAEEAIKGKLGLKLGGLDLPGGPF